MSMLFKKMKRKEVKISPLILSFILLIAFTLFLVRAFSPKEIDDVSPGIGCEENLLKKSDILWVIPKYKNISIAKNKEWCESIKRLNKTLGLHGVSHEFEEFGMIRNQEYLQEGMDIFEECFGYPPTLFKPPQLEINSENKKLIKENELILRGEGNQIAHKVSHCGDYGKWRNLIAELI